MNMDFVQFKDELVIELNGWFITFKVDTDYIARKVDKIYIIKQFEHEFKIAGDCAELYPEYNF